MSNIEYIAYTGYRPKEFSFGALTSRMNQKIEVRIEDLLKTRGKSVYWLAKDTGISYTTLWRLKTGKALGINFATLESICGALGCEPGDIMKFRTRENELKTTTPERAKSAAGSSH